MSEEQLAEEDSDEDERKLHPGTLGQRGLELMRCLGGWSCVSGVSGPQAEAPTAAKAPAGLHCRRMAAASLCVWLHQSDALETIQRTCIGLLHKNAIVNVVLLRPCQSSNASAHEQRSVQTPHYNRRQDQKVVKLTIDLPRHVSQQPHRPPFYSLAIMNRFCQRCSRHERPPR